MSASALVARLGAGVWTACWDLRPLNFAHRYFPDILRWHEPACPFISQSMTDALKCSSAVLQGEIINGNVAASVGCQKQLTAELLLPLCCCLSDHVWTFKSSKIICRSCIFLSSVSSLVGVCRLTRWPHAVCSEAPGLHIRLHEPRWQSTLLHQPLHTSTTRLSHISSGPRRKGTRTVHLTVKAVFQLISQV